MNKGMFWPCAVIALLGMNVAIVGVTVYFASSDTTMIPEPRYYERAVHFDEQVAQRAANARLGWSATSTLTLQGAALLTVQLFDRDAAPIRDALVRAEVIPNLRPRSRAIVALESTPDFAYTGIVPSNQHGLWTIRIEARRGSDIFTTELTATMPDPRSTPEAPR